ncbi:MAG TPA: C13 family peptidase [Moraxellaceae bacterium]|nr:C13 family peptidase [Moraxellaceae bacterium]
MKKAVPPLLSELARNVWAACHLLAFRRSALRWLAPTPRNFLVLLGLSLAVSFLFDFISEGWPGEWSPSGVAVYMLPAFVLLVFGQFLANRHGLWRLGLAPASIWLAADILLGLTQCVLLLAQQHNWISPAISGALPALYSFLYTWPILAVVFVFTRGLAWPWWERVVAFAVLLGVFTAWSLTFSDERLWYSTEPADEDISTSSRLVEEAVWYAQPRLLDRALAGIQPHRAGRTDWYFLGIGGDYYQGVFRQETETVRSLFDTRFGTSGRSVVLINNDDSVMSQPIATRTSIERAIKSIAARMDRNQDVLFLFITSHGSEDSEIELSYSPLELAAITPEWLRTVLDESGIRRRVIVLSACYSGSFIPVLRTPDTLVITAADAHHTSFGCSDDAELTYFGRAFFDEALRKEKSLRGAFDSASRVIRQREREQGYEPSHPQWAAGASIAADLPQLEQSLFPGRVPSTAAPATSGVH